MKSVLISILPHWALLIAEGKKTVEVRKTKPKLETPFKCYIYCTKDFSRGTLYKKPLDLENAEILQGKVIGEFVCDEIIKVGNYQEVDYSYMLWVKDKETTEEFCKNACLDEFSIQNYLGAKGGYGWHISNLVIYDKPRELSEFEKPREYIHINYRKRNSYFKGITRPPQSWCYVESEG